MDFMDGARRSRLGAREFAVPQESALLHAHLQLCHGLAVRARGFEGWERCQLGARPTTVYDLSGLPLFYDFPVVRSRAQAGFIRAAANKCLGDTIISVDLAPPGWDRRLAGAELKRVLETKYAGHTVRAKRLACYSYPKLAWAVDLVSPRGAPTTLLMDVGDFSIIPPEPAREPDELGQIAYSFLDRVPAERETKGRQVWEGVTRQAEDLIQRQPALEPATLSQLPLQERMVVINKVFVELQLIKFYTERVLDYCCHTGGCRDHECFCLHPQENGVHCARASGQMMLCYWRYCYSQHEIAVAYGVEDDDMTPVGAVVPGLESLTHNCFDATQYTTTGWSTCETEIMQRRPFMSCVPMHARACAGTRKANIWLVNQPQPRDLYIFDPWPPNTGAIYWQNFNIASLTYMFTLQRRTTNHA